jgi:general secretion pathway protein D
LFKLDFVEPQTLVEELEQALGGTFGKILDGLVRLVPLERLRSLLAISASRSAVVETKTWVEGFDAPSDTTDPHLYVFRLQNVKATDVAAILNEVFTGTQSNDPRHPDPDLGPGLRPVTVESDT